MRSSSTGAPHLLWRCAAAWLVAACIGPAASGRAADLDAFDLRSEPVLDWKLPKRLREISGLAAIGERIFAHDDERAIIYELDPRRERIVKAFQLGDPPVSGDFEGLAVAGERFFLVTSRGWLYEAREGDDGASVSYRAVDTGIGRKCEIEGLAFDPVDQCLLLLCKHSADHALRHFVAIHRWWLAGAPPPRPAELLVIPVEDIGARIEEEAFEPSGIERDPSSGNYFLVAARQAAAAEVTPAGVVVSARRLEPGRHRQAEGLTFTPRGELVLGDEGSKNRARIAVYAPPPIP
jgi:hypothetical protein